MYKIPLFFYTKLRLAQKSKYNECSSYFLSFLQVLLGCTKPLCQSSNLSLNGKKKKNKEIHKHPPQEPVKKLHKPKDIHLRKQYKNTVASGEIFLSKKYRATISFQISRQTRVYHNYTLDKNFHCYSQLHKHKPSICFCFFLSSPLLSVSQNGLHNNNYRKHNTKC